jgi:adenylate kinase
VKFHPQARKGTMKKYVIMGVQGSGKGTQAKLLCERYGLIHISVGDIFRGHIQERTKLAARIKRIMAEGKLVPDEIVIAMIQRRLDDHDWNHGFILDGFPRNRVQAEFFLETYDIDAVILIDVSDKAVIERIAARRLCAQCGADYNLVSAPPAKAGICNKCGGKLRQRPDDTEKAIRSRLQDYHKQTEPLLDVFRKKEVVVSVDGTKTPEKVFQEIRRKLKLPAVKGR